MGIFFCLFCLSSLKLEVPAFTTVVTKLVIALALRAVYTEGTVVMTTKVSNAEKYQNAFIQGLYLMTICATCTLFCGTRYTN